MPVRRKKRQPNILLLGIDSLRADHLSCYGYGRQTTPYLDRFAAAGALFEQYYSPNIPTTPGYTAMLTGRDLFSTQVVGLRHKGSIAAQVRTLPEILKGAGYNTTCVGFSGNAASRGFDTYLTFVGSGTWNQGRAPKAQNMNEVALPELERLAAAREPFFFFLRPVDAHTPYLPPAPYERMFYHGNECDPGNHSMDPVMAFKPFRDYIAMWLPPGITDKDYVIAQYDGAVAYMDACLQSVFTSLEALGILDETIVGITADHGETLYDHDCYFDHHGMYDQTIHVPLILRYPRRIPAGLRLAGYGRHPDLVPTLLDLAEIRPEELTFDGRSLMPMVRGEEASHTSELYITECTWMRKHGWRTPEWKLMLALEPDFHFKPAVELYNLVEDPGESHNLAEICPEVVAALRGRMERWIAQRELETGQKDPIFHQGDWHGIAGLGPFTSSQQAYDSLHIGDASKAARTEAASRKYAFTR
jgi:arylsulfatase A-like enzyme